MTPSRRLRRAATHNDAIECQPVFRAGTMAPERGEVLGRRIPAVRAESVDGESSLELVHACITGHLRDAGGRRDGRHAPVAADISPLRNCLLYTSDAAAEERGADRRGTRIT